MCNTKENKYKKTIINNRTPLAKECLVGLGIDTGGTFTDAVLFDFKEGKVLSKAKANTTPWKFSEGIMNAVSNFSSEELDSIDLVSLSTTLVTNAIVESRTQAVGLLLMPPGSFKLESFKHSPNIIIKGRMSITGEITELIDPIEIRNAVNEMLSVHKVQAFAVSSYGGSVNPELELMVKKIIREETGMDVCCGHELSDTLNFYIRAHTAVLNAGTIPVMEEFLNEMKSALSMAGINAPVMVVRGDGSVMSHSIAEEFPIQTALSGPAASMAGAGYLTELSDALVIDVGGTTSDIGFLEEGSAVVCTEGAQIGSWKTHVEAVDMLTAGLGGDSEIIFNRSEWIVGPRRIIPFCYMSFSYNYSEIIKSASDSIGNAWENTRAFQCLYLSGKEPKFTMTIQEEKIIRALFNGPLVLPVLSLRIGAGDWKFLRTDRLEQTGCILRAGLTPTDLYHAEGRLDMWNSSAALEYLNIIAACSDLNILKLKENLNNKISNTIGSALISRLFSDIPGRLELINPILKQGNRHMLLKSELQIPVIGLGAAAPLILGDTIKKLNGNLILPEHGDVANAIGAVISQVFVTLKALIVPTPQETYSVTGLKNGRILFETLEEAESICIDELKERIIIIARKAGTSDDKVTIDIETRTAIGITGDEVFLERIIISSIKGMPDLM